MYVCIYIYSVYTYILYTYITYSIVSSSQRVYVKKRGKNDPLLSAPRDSAAVVATDALACFHACKLPTSDSNRISQNDTNPLLIIFEPLDLRSF